MALAMIGEASRSVPGGLAQSYLDRLYRWQDQAEKHVRGNLGYVDGLLTHYWHGKKRDRRYIERWEILLRNGFDPNRCCAQCAGDWRRAHFAVHGLD